MQFISGGEINEETLASSAEYSSLLQEMIALSDISVYLASLYPYDTGLPTAAQTLQDGINALRK